MPSCDFPDCAGKFYVNPNCGTSRGGGCGGAPGMMRFTRGFRGGGGGAGGYGGPGGCGGGAVATCRVAQCAAGGATGYSTGDDTCYCSHTVVCTLGFDGRMRQLPQENKMTMTCRVCKEAKQEDQFAKKTVDLMVPY